MVITGGKGSLAGPVVGGLIFGLLPVFLRPIMAPEAQWIAYGGVLIVILFVLPRGIVPSLALRFARPRTRIDDGCPGRLLRTRRQGARVMTRGCLDGREGCRAFRRARGALGHEFYGRRGRDRQPDRAQRGRQDHGLQRRHRLSAADPRRGELSWHGAQRIEAAPDRRPRSGPHLPAHQRLSERHRLRQSADRAASAGQGESARRPFWGCRARGRPSAACGNAPANWSNGSASNVAPTILPARCPMASSGWSAWRWRWPPSRRCCCSTSRSPA